MRYTNSYSINQLTCLNASYKITASIREDKSQAPTLFLYRPTQDKVFIFVKKEIFDLIYNNNHRTLKNNYILQKPNILKSG